VADRCRACGGEDLSVVLDLGHHPLADRFLTAEDLDRPEIYYPLRLELCASCCYVGLSHLVDPRERYVARPYSYTSGNSPVSRRHFASLAAEIHRRAQLSQRSLAVDVGGNDGTLLLALREVSGCRVLGVEPSSAADVAEASGVDVIRDFLTDGAVARVASRGGADVVVATNVLNHADDPVGFLRRARDMLAPGGVVVVEVPSLDSMISGRAFDTAYLEHASYFCAESLRFSFVEAGLHFVDCSWIHYLDGSIRAWGIPRSRDVARAPSRSIVDRLRLGFSRLQEDARVVRERLGHLLRGCISRDRPSVGLCASAKGNTLLNYCRVGADVLPCIVDASPHKVGRWAPGSRVPIVAEIPDGADRAIVLAPNLLDHLRERHPGVDLVLPRDLVRK